MTSRVTLVAERTTRPVGWWCFGAHVYMSDRGGGFQRGRWIVTCVTGRASTVHSFGHGPSGVSTSPTRIESHRIR